MAEGRIGPEWDELGRIDYFLDQLARAVERNEVPRESYERLAPRYLERRGQLVGTIDRRREREEGARAAQTPGAYGQATAPSQPSAVGQQAPARQAVQQTAAQHTSSIPPVPPPSPVANAPLADQRDPVQVPWTTVLTFVGAFLVVVAAAIFAVATWDVFSVEFKLLFMGSLSAAFYGAAEWVDRKLEIRFGTYALAIVSAATLLFGGWILIDGYNLEGPLPWAVMLLVLSSVYWAMEIRLTGGFFGIIGAAAQVGWWWLMTAALGWPVIWRAAGMVFVAIVWDLAARRVNNDGPARNIAQVLSWGSLAILAMSVGVALFDVARIGHVTLEVVAAAGVIGAGGMVLLYERPPLHASLAAIASAPFVLSLGMLAWREPSVSLALIILVAAVVYAVYELARGGYVFAVLAAMAEIGFWLVLVDLLDLSAEVGVGTVATVGLVMVAASVLMSRYESHEVLKMPGAASLRLVLEGAGWIVLAVTTLLVPFAAEELLPLTGGVTSRAHALLAAWISVLWLVAAGMKRLRPVGAVAVGFTFYTLSAILAAVAPNLHSAHYAAALCVLALAWSQAGRGAGIPLGLKDDDLMWGMRALSGGILAVGIAVSAVDLTFNTWATVLLLTVVTLFWIADAARFGWVTSWGIAAAGVVSVASVSVLVLRDTSTAALAGATVGLVLASSAYALASWRSCAEESAVVFGVGAAVAATVASLAAFGEPIETGVSLLLASLAWIVCSTVVSRRPLLALIGAGLATVAVAQAGVPPLLGEPTSVELAWFSVAATLIWILVAHLAQSAPVGAISMVASFYATAAVLGAYAPGWDSAWYALVLLALALGWSQARSMTEIATRLPSFAAVWMARAASVLVLAGGLLGTLVYHDAGTWPMAALVAGFAAFWCADALRSDDDLPIPVSAASVVAAAAWAAWVGAGVESAALAGAGVSLLACIGSVVSIMFWAETRPRERAGMWAFAAAGAGTLSAVNAGWSTWWLVGAFALSTLAWVCVAWVVPMPLISAAAAIMGLFTGLSALSAADAPAWGTVVLCGVYGYALLAPSFMYGRGSASGADSQGSATDLRATTTATVLSLVGLFVVALPTILSLMTGWSPEVWASWLQVVGHPLAVSVALFGGWLLVASAAYGIEVGVYAGWSLVLAAVFVEFRAFGIDQVEIYSTILALYLAAMGYLFARLGPGRVVPGGTDAAAVVVGLGLPAIQVLRGGSQALLFTHAVWAVGLALLAIVAGVLLKTRAYFFGGVALIVWVAFWRSLTFLVTFWWLGLGIIGVLMLVVALTWERQRMILSETSARMKGSFEGWR